MSFTAPNAPNIEAESNGTVENHSFFPELSLDDFRSVMRVDAVTTPERAIQVLKTAMLEANGRLWEWARYHMIEGITKIEETPPRPGHPAGANKHLYLQAVWSLAKALLIERYRDYDTTNTGNKKADMLEDTAEDHRRNAAWAINDITGTARATVELI